MATQTQDDRDLYIQEQIARICLAQEESDTFSAETRKLIADMLKAEAKVAQTPRSLIFQAMLATAALLGAGAAIAKLFFP